MAWFNFPAATKFLQNVLQSMNSFKMFCNPWIHFCVFVVFFVKSYQLDAIWLDIWILNSKLCLKNFEMFANWVYCVLLFLKSLYRYKMLWGLVNITPFRRGDSKNEGISGNKVSNFITLSNFQTSVSQKKRCTKFPWIDNYKLHV